MEDIESFFEFEKSINTDIRGGIMMYDIKGHFKYLTLSELFDYWFDNVRGK